MTKLLERLRRLLYWSIDFIKGSPIKNHYNEIKYILENPGDSKVIKIQRENLERLLTHSVKTTSYYKKHEDYNSLSDFPVINKNIVLENYESFKSVKFKNIKLHEASSSGSTGIPFRILHNKNKRNRNTADSIYFLNLTNSKIGYQSIYIRLWDHEDQKSIFEKFKQNILSHDVTQTSNDEISKLISKIKKSKSNKFILGYPSFFEQVCVFLEKQNYSPKDLGIKSIISFAESLNDYEREKMSFYFQAPIFERYSNQENGIFAQQTKNSNGKYKLNWASYFIEILDPNSDNHVKSGELGRIVVTDLFNYSMPLIRYDTGDMAIYEEIEHQHPVFSKIYGRRNHMIYSTSGKILSPFIFYMVLEHSKAKQFQFIQTHQTKYSFVLNAKKTDTNEIEIINCFKNYLGNDAVISFEYVNEIPILSSGKRIKVRNDWKK